MAEMDINLSFDRSFNTTSLAGIDEAGRGPLAGPVVAAAVMLPDSFFLSDYSRQNPSSESKFLDQPPIISGIQDSKKISAKKREKLFKEITEQYIWAVGIVEPEEIDEINILEATKKACCIANDNLSSKAFEADIVLVDGNMKFTDERFLSIIKGDDKSHIIAAASIVAKVTRDRIMHELHLKHPEYKWLSNSGYGTKEHIEAITELGLSPYHRKSFCKRFGS